jgi:putative RNA 2'-phosphotransferase
MDEVKISKFMSLVLRHEPQALGIELDSNGWTSFETFAAKMQFKFGVTTDELKRLVATNPKQRFIIEEGKIRANQGHSVEIDLALKPVLPPDVLFHGTTRNAWASINVQGLLKAERTHVHLSADIPTAEIVSKRRKGPWVILAVAAKQLSNAGQNFFKSENGVWLVDHVPPSYITLNKEWGHP